MIEFDRRQLLKSAGLGLGAAALATGAVGAASRLVAPASAKACTQMIYPPFDPYSSLCLNKVKGESRFIDQIIDLDESKALRVFRFEPSFVLLEPGEELLFKNNLNQHTVNSVKGMLPEGADEFSLQFQAEASVRFQQEGVYGIKCRAHARYGMVMLVVVGDPGSNLNAARYRGLRQRRLAGQAFEQLFTKLDQHFSA
ncbi:plastocyanin/azurin family copper-binding protein [Rhodovibrionaceae bacterium A322]